MYDIIAGDVGTQFNFTLYDTDGWTLADISTATSAYLYILYPDGVTTIKRTCTISSTPCSMINYVSQAGDFPEVGTYSLEAQVTFTGGAVLCSNVVLLIVANNIIPT